MLFDLKLSSNTVKDANLFLKIPPSRKLLIEYPEDISRLVGRTIAYTWEFSRQSLSNYVTTDYQG